MHIAKLVSRLFKLFISSIIEEIAKTSGFIKRHSKLLPETFTKAITFGLLNTKNITELYRIRWQIELLFKVLKRTFSTDKVHMDKTKYIESILYGRLIGALMTMPLYGCLDQTLLSSKGKDVSNQRFYTLLNKKYFNLEKPRLKLTSTTILF